VQAKRAELSELRQLRESLRDIDAWKVQTDTLQRCCAWQVVLELEEQLEVHVGGGGEGGGVGGGGRVRAPLVLFRVRVRVEVVSIA
jgi:hypothetical protein